MKEKGEVIFLIETYHFHGYGGVFFVIALLDHFEVFA